MYPLLLVLCLFFSAQVLIQPIHATRSHYRMVLDYSKVFCTGPLPKRTFGEITQNWSIYNTRWSHLNFTSLADLCSAHGNPQGNMGGMCLQSGSIYFDPHRGLEALLKDSRLKFECREGCFCVDNENEYLAEDLKEAARRKGLADEPAMPRMGVPIPQLPQLPKFSRFPKMPQWPKLPQVPQWPKRPRMPQVKPFRRSSFGPSGVPPRKFGPDGQPPRSRKPPAPKNLGPR